MKKKRILAILMSLVLCACALTACGGSETTDDTSSTEENSKGEEKEEEQKDPYEGLTLYEPSCGVTLYMRDGFKEDTVDGFAFFYETNDCAVNCQEETFEDLESVGYNGDMTIEEYAQTIRDLYEEAKDSEVLTDDYGNVYIVYTQDVDGMNFTYYDFFKKGSTSFWATNFMCITDDKDSFEEDFHLWASSITVP